MINPKQKMLSLLCIIAGFILTGVAINVARNSYEYQTSGTIDGTGLLISSAGFLIWLFGFVKYGQAKGRSGLLAAFLSFFSLPGLIVLLLLRDKHPSGNQLLK